MEYSAWSVHSADKRVSAAMAAPIQPAEPGCLYVVQKGDNLTRIARRCDVNLQALANANKLQDPNHLLVGMKLVIPQE